MKHPVLTLAATLCLVAPVAAQEAGVVTTPSGLKVTTLTAGTGAAPKVGDAVVVHYRGTFPKDGKPFEFDASYKRKQPFVFMLGKGQVIKGWDEGLTHLKKGGKAKLEIPWKLAYGERGSPPVIPAKQDLTFEIELLRIIPAPLGPFGAKAESSPAGKFEVLSVGDGEAVTAENAVEMYVALFDPRGRSVRGFPRELRFPVADMPPFLKPVALKLKKGGTARVEVPMGRGGPGGPMGRAYIQLLDVRKPLPLPAFKKPGEKELTKTASGLQYQILAPGEGAAPKPTDKVTVHYVGWLEDGTVFDSSYKRAWPADFPLNRVVKGWTEGLQLLKPGGEAILVIPPNLGYGGRAQRKIPANSTLIFRVKLIKIGE